MSSTLSPQQMILAPTMGRTPTPTTLLPLLAQAIEQVQFLVSDKTEVLQAALGSKAVDLLADLELRLRLTLRSLQLPLAALDERRRLFEQKLAEAEQQRLAAQDLLGGDHRRLVTLLEEQAEQLRQRARRHFDLLAQTALAQAGGDMPDEQAVQAALAEAIPGFFEHELGELSRAFEQRVSQALAAHQQRADALVETIRRGAAELFDLAYQPLDSHGVFTFERQPYWVTHQWRTSLSPFTPQLIDHFLPRRWQQARRLNRLQGQLESLVIYNVENLRWATLQNLDHAIRRFSSALDERLQETGAATQGAIRTARRQRQEHAEIVTEAVARLEAAVNELEQLQARLQMSLTPAP
jgi:hypothetical protein